MKTRKRTWAAVTTGAAIGTVAAFGLMRAPNVTRHEVASVSSSTASQISSITFDRPATVSRVIDGDTLDVEIDLGLGISLSSRVRLMAAGMNGVNAPEIRGGSAETRTAGRQSTDALEELVMSGQVRIRSFEPARRDSFGRILAEVWVETPEGFISTADKLIELGLAERTKSR